MLNVIKSFRQLVSYHSLRIGSHGAHRQPGGRLLSNLAAVRKRPHELAAAGFIERPGGVLSEIRVQLATGGSDTIT